MTGELRLDLTSPTSAARLGEFLNELDDLELDRSQVEISLQFATGHVPDVHTVGNVSNGITHPRAIGGLELVASWTV